MTWSACCPKEIALLLVVGPKELLVFPNFLTSFCGLDFLGFRIQRRLFFFEFEKEAGSLSNTTSEGFTPFIIDPSHPLYVHPSDSPNSQLVSVPFNGCSFVLWRSNMLTSLSAKNKLGILDGRVPQPPPDSPYYLYWERCNDIVKKDIHERFGQSNGSKYLQIQREISTITQGSSGIATYFTKLRSLWNELNSSYVGPVCSCGALPKFIEDQQLLQLLNGLNKSYSTVKSVIMMMHPLPPISKAYSFLQQDESQKEAISTLSNFSGDSASFSVSLTQYNNNRNFTQKVNYEPNKNVSTVSCKYCKKPGHTVEKYYRLHGFSPDFKFTKNKKSASCVQGDISYPQPSPGVSQPPGNSVPVHGFTKEKYQHLLTLFQQVQASPGSVPTIHPDEDSAFSHFAGPSLKRPLVIGKAGGRLYYLHPDRDLFPSTTSSLSSFIDAPCNEFVFYVGSIPCNKFVPAPSHVNVPPSCNQTSTVNKMDLLWHQRLGHMPFHKMQSNPFLFCLIRYFLTLVDDFTRVTWTHILSSKSNALSILKAFTFMLHGHPPSYNHIRSFGCLCFATSPKVGRDKFQSRAIACTFMGYPCGKKGYKLLNLSSSSVFHPCHPESSPSFNHLPSSSPPIVSPVTPSTSPNSTATTFLLPLLRKSNRTVAAHLAWQEAMLKEFHALEANQTWGIVPLPSNKKLDVNNAFLHSDLHEEVYIKIPPNLDVSFVSSSAPLVDDILLAGDDLTKMNSLKSFLDDQFKIKDLGSVHYFLGLEITKTPQGYVMSQLKYTTNLLAEFNCHNFTSVVTPLDPYVKLTLDMGDPLPDPSVYRRLIGKLNFLQYSRPDISFSVQHLS
ncbi:uncharacterized protein [Nicotiana tomentosiformis]|uniref:uncharacterized protein n=1 Tax=Nicotiana tomentosiformis TaxID=4098 RepID=UPI00388C980D